MSFIMRLNCVSLKIIIIIKKNRYQNFVEENHPKHEVVQQQSKLVNAPSVDQLAVLFCAHRWKQKRKWLKKETE